MGGPTGFRDARSGLTLQRAPGILSDLRQQVRRSKSLRHSRRRRPPDGTAAWHAWHSSRGRLAADADTSFILRRSPRLSLGVDSGASPTWSTWNTPTRSRLTATKSAKVLIFRIAHPGST